MTSIVDKNKLKHSVALILSKCQSISIDTFFLSSLLMKLLQIIRSPLRTKHWHNNNNNNNNNININNKDNDDDANSNFI